MAKAIVGTISGTSMSFGTAVTSLETGDLDLQYNNATYHVHTQSKVIVIMNDENDSGQNSVLSVGTFTVDRARTFTTTSCKSYVCSRF